MGVPEGDLLRSCGLRVGYTRSSMSLKIDQDHSRFRHIVRGKIRQNLRKYISQGELIGRKGKDLVSIPIPQIDIPRFRFGDKQQGGVGQGDGERGRSARRRRGSRGRPGQAGGQGRRRARARGRRHARRAGGHPRRGARAARHPGQGQEQDHQRARTATPASAASVPSRCATSSARTARRSSARSRWARTSPKRPVIVPVRDDKRYRSWKTETEPVANAVIIYMMDVSRLDGRRAEGDRAHRELLDRYLAAARNTRASRAATSSTTPSRARSIATRSSTRASRGGTMISSAYKLCRRDHRRRLPAERVEHLPVPLLRRRQLVDGRHARLRRAPRRRSSCRA